MKEISDTILCVIDHGLFQHVAQCLAQKAKLVYYCGPTERVMAKLEDSLVGDGFENIVRVKSLWDVKSDCDGFCFPDIGFNGEQKELLSQGYPVFGHRGADALEVYKGKFLKTLSKLKMEVPPHTVINGMTQLREFLQDEEDVFVKIDQFRGDWETFHFRNWKLDEGALDYRAYRLGAAKEHITFYVFDKIDADIEDGIDTWRVGGQWPSRVLHAMEKKDKALIGGIQDFADVAEPVREVNELFGPVLDKYGMCGFFSTEVRLNDKAYFIDPTVRAGSPPSQIQTHLITNLPEVIWAGANGECLDPETQDEEVIGAQVLITTEKEKDAWCAFDMPKELTPFVRAAFSCEMDGALRILPNPLDNWAGWLLAKDKTIEGVIDKLKERVALLPAGFSCDITCFASLLDELNAAKEQDIKITSERLPEPEVVL